MKLSEPVQWLIVYTPFILSGLFTMFGVGLILLPVLGSTGVFVALFSGEPAYTTGFRLATGLAAGCAIAMFVAGWRFRKYFRGKLLNAAGFYLWCITGLVGYGPQ